MKLSWPKRISFKAAMGCWGGVLILAFASFIVCNESRVHRQAAENIEDHAAVVALDVWTFDVSGPGAYLDLAARAHGYLSISVYDDSGGPFLTLNNDPFSRLDHSLVSLGLIRISSLSAPIRYHNRIIGRIDVEWPNLSVYLYLNLLLWALLLWGGIGLVLKLVEARRTLQSRVQLRTAELEKEIAEHKQTEQALRAEQQRLTLHVMNTPLGVIEWDPSGKVMEWNKAAEHIFGFGRDEVLGRQGIGLIFAEHDRDRVGSVWSQLLSHSGGSRTVESNLTSTGQLKVCEWYNTSLTDTHGRVLGVASLVLDITERKKAELENQRLQSQLLQSQKMEAVGTLAGGVAHDFNNILQAITGNTQLLLMTAPRDGEQYPRLQAIETAAKRAAELVRQLLTFSRKIDSNLLPINLNRELLQTRILLERTIPKMITIDLELAEQSPMVLADAVQIEQVVVNLAINGMHAMQEGGTLKITTEVFSGAERQECGQPAVGHDSGCVRLSISDTGVGIPQNVLPHIFEPFFTTKGVGQGTGLGLSIAYGIIRNHQGRIECFSSAKRGTTFVITLPLLSGSVYRGEKAPEKEIVGGAENILLVDDEEEIRLIGSELLTSYGYQVTSASSAEEGMEIYNKGGVDLILLDLNMPGMGGFECLRMLRARDTEIPILIASGYTPARVVDAVVGDGASGVIAKPFQLAELLQTVRNTLDQAAAQT